MKKLVSTLGFLVAVAALAGCELYFDGNGSSGGSRPPSGSGGSGYGCTSDTDCAAGCYCDASSGTCTEGGFCAQDSDCGPGYHCDTMRSSCEPNPAGCTADADCPSGSVCTNGTCTSTCACMTDADAVSQGFGYCDETRSTCENGSDPNGSCGGAISCLLTQGSTPPSCPSGEVPLISNGCYTGACEAIGSCDTAPGCTVINDESDCLGRTDCAPSYNGINCHKPDGTACHSGDTNCTCGSFVFDHCTSKGSGRLTGN